MQKIIMPVGIPSSGKSTWAKEEIKKDPEGTTRINRDDLRNMMSNYHFSDKNEKLVTKVRDAAIIQSLKRGRNLIIDETNINRRNFDDVCKIVKELNIDCMVMEKLFYIELEEALDRDSKRIGSAQVGEAVIKKFWRKSGGTQHKHYKPRVEVFYKNQCGKDEGKSLVQDANLPRAVIFDNDGTISLLNGRDPYNASTCDNDMPHEHVIECMKLYFQAGYKILFVSGREDKDREPTEKFYKKHFPEVEYKLFMRKSGDQRKDVIIKEEIYNEHIKDKYYIAGWFDDRLQIVKWLYEKGFPVFRVGNPEANF